MKDLLSYDKKNKTERMKYIDYGLGILSKSAFEEFKDKKFLIWKKFINLIK
ncbi:MAG: hypothetical protein IPM38_18665 [Ignavibacteria bacterium]|nr:hypothetical protein [Ignavibacteria bacterium]